MHRKDQLHKNVQDWLDLDLPETCTAMDMFTSLNVKRVGMRVEFNQKFKGNTRLLGLAMLNPDGTMNGVVIPGCTTPIMSLILFGLEKAVESN